MTEFSEEPSRLEPLGECNFASGTVWTGDNLHVLRGINSRCVDLIYLDPPFNSNRNYSAPIGSEGAVAAFKDAWTLDDVDVHEHGELADRNPAAYAVIEAARQAHGKGMMAYCIMMAVRLLEMQRVLKPSGSIYLHCDPTASHYLKLLMDSVFGPKNFRNEIVWCYRKMPNKIKAFQKNHDLILFYSNSNNFDFNVLKGEMTEGSKKTFESGKRKGYNVNLSKKMVTVFNWERYEKAIIEKKIPNDLNPVEFKGGNPPEKDWWEIKILGGPKNKERTGYPTQKPLALLERIVLASSNLGDMVFDPFCGCATSLVVADRLNRKWAGVDLSSLAVKLVDDRITEDRGPIWGGATALIEPPKRTDLGKIPNYRTHRHRLYGEQEGICVGCKTHFPFRVMDVDHILPRSLGGTDHPDNLQLLCSGCNRSKGSKTMAEWRAAHR